MNNIPKSASKHHCLNYGRSHITEWCNAYIRSQNRNAYTVLDIGCGRGKDLQNIRNAASNQVALYGIEIHEPAIRICEESKITVFPIDIEKTAIPVGDHFFDILILNQVLEHTKEIFFVFSEISRVLKPDGIVIIGVPNLASLHNRILLLMGRQPTCIEVLGPHVRGFTISSLKKFIEMGDYFHVIEIKGANFYPFPPSLSTRLSRAFPGLSASFFFLVVRTDKSGNFIDVLEKRHFETNYVTGAAI